jgi:hypothetical protein
MAKKNSFEALKEANADAIKKESLSCAANNVEKDLKIFIKEFDRMDRDLNKLVDFVDNLKLHNSIIGTNDIAKLKLMIKAGKGKQVQARLVSYAHFIDKMGLRLRRLTGRFDITDMAIAIMDAHDAVDPDEDFIYLCNMPTKKSRNSKKGKR